MFGHTLTEWAVFHVILISLLSLDLGVFNRKAHIISVKEALLWSVFWIIIGTSFSFYVGHTSGKEAAVQYITGYIVEKSLSVDNLFVFLIIFQTFRIERQHQHRLLFWGIFGAIILRGLMIFLGAQLLEHFHWVIYIFGAFLVYTGFKLMRQGGQEMDPRKSPVFSLANRYLPISPKNAPGHFMTEESGRRMFTMSFLALIMIESSDVVFALDSVPAVFGVTRDPYLVYTSNIFAILGLRSLYFVLEDLLQRFHMLKYGLAVTLMFVGAKMLGEHYLKISSEWSLVVIGAILGLSIIASLAIPPKDNK